MNFFPRKICINGTLEMLIKMPKGRRGEGDSYKTSRECYVFFLAAV